jgi:hypothetical protein
MTAIALRLRSFTVNWRQVAALALLLVTAAVMVAMHEKEIGLVLAGAAAGYITNNGGRERDHVPPQRPAA